MKNAFIIFSYFREYIKNWESEIPLSPPEKQAGKGIRLKFHCAHCGSTNLKSGAGRKPGEESHHCKDCRKFLGYQPISQLKRLRRQRRLTDCLNLLESHGVSSETAQLFVLAEVGAIGGES